MAFCHSLLLSHALSKVFPGDLVRQISTPQVLTRDSRLSRLSKERYRPYRHVMKCTETA